MRDQIARILFEAAADTAPDRITPIVVAAIGGIAAILTTLIVAFARKPATPNDANELVAGLREDIRIRDRRLGQRDREIDRLQAICWGHGINPKDGSQVTPP